MRSILRMLFSSLLLCGCSSQSPIIPDGGGGDLSIDVRGSGNDTTFDRGNDVASDPCKGMVCTTPPANACLDASTLRSYVSVGACASGACRYDHTDTKCVNGCANAACVGTDPCTGVTCNNPPPPACQGTATLRTYSSSGTCSNGVCSYTATDVACTAPAHAKPACANATCGFTCDSNYQPSGSICVPITNVTWSAKVINTSYQFYAVWGSGPSDVYAVGYDNSKKTALIYHTADGGQVWSPQPSGAGSAELLGVWGSSASDVYVVGGVVASSTSGTILHTGDGGTTWTPQSSGTTEVLNGVWGSGPHDVYVISSGSTILHSADLGVTWPKLQLGVVTISGMGVWGSSASDVYFVDAHSILHTANSGKNITQHPFPYSLRSMWGSGGADLYAVGAGGVIVHTANAGGSWSPQTSGSTTDLSCVWGSGTTDVYAVGANGVILHTANSGLTAWTKQVSGTSNALFGVWGSGAGDVYAVGAGGIILHGQ